MSLEYFEIALLLHQKQFSHKRLGNMGDWHWKQWSNYYMDSQTHGFASCPLTIETILGLKETKGKFSVWPNSNQTWAIQELPKELILYTIHQCQSSPLPFKTHWTIEHNGREWGCKDEHKWLLQQGACGKTERPAHLCIKWIISN